MELTLRTYEYGSSDYRKALILRNQVLSLQPGVNEISVEAVFDSHLQEREHMLLGAFQEDALIATLNLQKQEDGSLLLRQFAVFTPMQGTGIGSRLIRFAHEYAKSQGYRRIWLHSRLPAVKFYQRAGYRLTGIRNVYPEITLDEMVIDLE